MGFWEVVSKLVKGILFIVIGWCTFRCLLGRRRSQNAIRAQNIVNRLSLLDAEQKGKIDQNIVHKIPVDKTFSIFLKVDVENLPAPEREQFQSEAWIERIKTLVRGGTVQVLPVIELETKPAAIVGAWIRIQPRNV